MGKQAPLEGGVVMFLFPFFLGGYGVMKQGSRKFIKSSVQLLDSSKVKN